MKISNPIKTMSYKTYSLLLLIFISSFYDEIGSFLLSFSKAGNNSLHGISILMTGAILGGVISTFIIPKILDKFSIKFLIPISFLLGAFIFITCLFVNESFLIYFTTFFLGFINNVFWVSVSAFVKLNFSQNLLEVNSIIQSIKNAGYIAGPALAGISLGLIGLEKSFLLIIALNIIAFIFCLNLKLPKEEKNHNNVLKKESSLMEGLGIILKNKLVRHTLLPLSVTIMLSSSMNVIYMNIGIIQLKYSYFKYGILSASLSIGLLIGPIFLSRIFSKLGLSMGSCTCAAIIGGCMFFLSLSNVFYFSIFILFILGLANGVQNSLMATFIMEYIPDEKLNSGLSAYSLFLQFFVMIGLLTAGFIKPENAILFLTYTGIIVFFVGAISAIVNKKTSITFKNTPQV